MYLLFYFLSEVAELRAVYLPCGWWEYLNFESYIYLVVFSNVDSWQSLFILFLFTYLLIEIIDVIYKILVAFIVDIYFLKYPCCSHLINLKYLVNVILYQEYMYRRVLIPEPAWKVMSVMLVSRRSSVASDVSSGRTR